MNTLTKQGCLENKNKKPQKMTELDRSKICENTELDIVFSLQHEAST